MAWNRTYIDEVAKSSAPADYAAFEEIGLSEMEDIRVLDVGCFDGSNTVLKFAPYSGISEVVGIDPDAGYIELAKQATDDARFTWKASSFEDYDTPPESFDVVYFSHVFQHLADKDAVTKKALSLLKPGGFVIIKTVDDGLKASAPDPDALMQQVFNVYDKYVCPNVAHTKHTDRYNGSKCYDILKRAGFSDITVGVFHSNTIDMDATERQAFFDRMTYFRKNVPEAAGKEAAEDMASLLSQWNELFLQDNYYFDSPTLVWIARKEAADNQSNSLSNIWSGSYAGDVFGTGCNDAKRYTDSASSLEELVIRPMTEDDLSQVMAIELQSFPSPWTPIAYAMELRHNKNAHYVVIHDQTNCIKGYIGWWYGPEVATIAHVAVDPSFRRKGLGRKLINEACKAAQNAGMPAMMLQVRKANETARKFYESLGFEEAGVSKDYYTNPDDDGIIMIRTLVGTTLGE